MINNWIKLAITAAEEASTAILDVYSKPFDIERKADDSPVTNADKNSSQIIQNHLAQTGITIISEEEKHPTYATRKNEEYVWIVDPLDGTKEFIRKNGEFCICIALVKNNKPYLGLIASPTTKKIIIGGKEIGTYYFEFGTSNFKDDCYKLPPIKAKTIQTIIHSRSHLSPQTADVLEKLSAQKERHAIKMGSALKFIELAQNNAQIYPRTAPTMEWDIAAGHAIYEGVGGEVIDFSTFAPLTYNKEDLYNPYFIAKPKSIRFKHEK